MKQIIKACFTIIFGATIQFVASSGVAAEAAHQTVSCSLCHSSSSISSASFSAPVSKECEACHPSDLFSDSQFHAAASNRCIDCHDFHEPEKITINSVASSWDSTRNFSVGHCQACHDRRGSLKNLSPSHKVAARLYHNGADQLYDASPSEACLWCHSNTSTSNWKNTPGVGTLAFNTHASHPYSIRVLPGVNSTSNWVQNDIDPQIPLFDGFMECQTCHLLTSGNETSMIPFPNEYDLCNGCHQQERQSNSMASLNLQ